MIFLLNLWICLMVALPNELSLENVFHEMMMHSPIEHRDQTHLKNLNDQSSLHPKDYNSKIEYHIKGLLVSYIYSDVTPEGKKSLIDSIPDIRKFLFALPSYHRHKFLSKSNLPDPLIQNLVSTDYVSWTIELESMPTDLAVSILQSLSPEQANNILQRILDDRFMNVNAIKIYKALAFNFHIAKYPYIEFHYTGQSKNQVPHGVGYLHRFSIDRMLLVYSGLFNQGEFVNGLKFNQDEEKIYKGGFANYLYDGKGVEYYPSTGKVKYNGGFKEGLYHGNGAMFDEEGVLLYGAIQDTNEKDKFTAMGLFEKGSYDMEQIMHRLEKSSKGAKINLLNAIPLKSFEYAVLKILKRNYDGVSDLLNKEFYFHIPSMERVSTFAQKRNGIPNGVGIQREYDPSTKHMYLLYSGEFKDGNRHGHGTLYFSNGAIHYKGQFANGVYSGLGNQYTSDGQLIYSGEFLDGKRNGIGKEYLSEMLNSSLYVYPSLLLYKGSFKDNAYDGFGVLYNLQMPGYQLYKGYFKSGRYDGEGVEFHPETGITIFRGEYNRGKLIQGEAFNADGSFKGKIDSLEVDETDSFFKV